MFSVMMPPLIDVAQLRSCVKGDAVVPLLANTTINTELLAAIRRECGDIILAAVTRLHRHTYVCTRLTTRLAETRLATFSLALDFLREPYLLWCSSMTFGDAPTVAPCDATDYLEPAGGVGRGDGQCLSH